MCSIQYIDKRLYACVLLSGTSTFKANISKLVFVVNSL